MTKLGDEFQLSEAEKAEPLKTGGTRLYNRVGWARTYLVKAGLLRKVGTGRFEATDRGRNLLADPPPRLDVDYLKTHFPEIAAFHGEEMAEDPPATFNPSTGLWNQRSGIAQRIEGKLTRTLGDEADRRLVLDFLGWAIETADGERSDAWYLRETGYGLRLMAGRLLAFEIRRAKVGVPRRGVGGEGGALHAGRPAGRPEGNALEGFSPGCPQRRR